MNKCFGFKTNWENSSSKEIVKPKRSLLKLTTKGGRVSEACKVSDYGRDSFYRFKKRYDKDGEFALLSIDRSKPLSKNRIKADIEKAVVSYASKLPQLEQQQALDGLAVKGITHTKIKDKSPQTN